MTLTPQQPRHGAHDQTWQQSAYPPPGAVPMQRSPQVQPVSPPIRRPIRPWLIAVYAGVVVLIAVLGLVTRTPAETPSASGTGTPAAPAPTYSPPTYSAPTSSAAPVQAEPAPQTVTGTGDQVVRLSAPRDYAVVTFACTSCSGNVVVKADDALLVNEIGRYSGKTIYGMSGASSTSPLSRLQINAKGSWTLTVGGLTTARQVPSFPTQGTGDDVLLVTDPNDVATFSHDGESNFAVWAGSESGGTDLVVNEIGRYDGTVILPDDGQAMLVAITADGAWTLR